MKTTVFHIIEKHRKLLEEREKAIKNVEYPWNSKDTTIEFVEELQRINDEIYEFLDTRIETY